MFVGWDGYVFRPERPTIGHGLQVVSAAEGLDPDAMPSALEQTDGGLRVLQSMLRRRNRVEASLRNRKLERHSSAGRSGDRLAMPLTIRLVAGRPPFRQAVGRQAGCAFTRRGQLWRMLFRHAHVLAEDGYAIVRTSSGYDFGMLSR